ncbi:MAG: endonuclease domain-containing protein [Alphaproteobacteria bacterium]
MTEPRVTLCARRTDPERLLWGQLRDKRVEGLRFRRQFPIGPYVVDFACLPARLGIEIDGPSHDLTAEGADAHRTAWLEFAELQCAAFHHADGDAQT